LKGGLPFASHYTHVRLPKFFLDTWSEQIGPVFKEEAFLVFWERNVMAHVGFCMYIELACIQILHSLAFDINDQSLLHVHIHILLFLLSLFC
jgi:hypothetical protein